MRVKLGDVAAESRETLKGSKSGLPVVGLEHITPEELTLSAWDVDSENTFTKTFRKGQILFGRRRAYLKKAAVAPCDGICSGDITVIAAKPEKLSPELLPFVIQNDRFFDFAMEKSAGSLSPRAKWEHLRHFEFDLPPMQEQRRLAELLWAANAAREAYKKLISAADELVKSQFVEMFGDKGFPKIRLREVSTLITKGTTPTTYGYNFENEGVNFVKIENISEDGAIDGYGLMKISRECHDKLNRSQLAEGDLLFSIAGALGRCAVVSEAILPANTNQACAIIRLATDSTINRAYLIAALRSPLVKEQYELQKQGIAQLNLSLQNVGDLLVPLPPLDMQNRFAAFAEAADKSKFALQRTLDELEATYKAILRERLG